jgi:hypothetical protein
VNDCGDGAADDDGRHVGPGRDPGYDGARQDRVAGVGRRATDREDRAELGRCRHGGDSYERATDDRRRAELGAGADRWERN